MYLSAQYENFVLNHAVSLLHLQKVVSRLSLVDKNNIKKVRPIWVLKNIQASTSRKNSTGENLIQIFILSMNGFMNGILELHYFVFRICFLEEIMVGQKLALKTRVTYQRKGNLKILKNF